MNENIGLNESPRAKPGTPGTGSAHKTGASYRHSPHTFAAHHEPGHTVLLEVEQNYTGRRQWFRFTREEWDQLTASEPDDNYEIDSANEIALNRIESSACDQ